MKNNTIHRRKTTRLISLGNRPRPLSDALRAPARRERSFRPFLESVEGRVLLSGSSPIMMPLAVRLGPPQATPLPSGVAPEGSSAPGGAYTPAQLQQAYGFAPIQFTGGIKGDGSGQTIAIVDAYSDPNITGDLQAFDKQFSLPAPPTFQVWAMGGALEGTDPAGPGAPQSWELEESLDVEWAHAMAPGASIILVETLDATPDNLYAGVQFAASLPGVSVVSMSFGGGENFLEFSHDSTFTTPSGHAGVTFVAGSGDSGTISYPAASPNVLGVGGTNVNLDSTNNISSETAWSGSGGGVSQYEFLPSYQVGMVPSGTTRRASPDVAYNAGINVAVCDSYDNGATTPWSGVAGTSAGTPQWAALIAIANQGRALYGLPTLDGPSQTLPLIYSAPSLDFNDITSGSNKGYSAGPGYDMVTGRGSPKADLVVYSLIGQNFSLSDGVLTVDGDQLGVNYDDTVTLGLTSSGGVEVTLNGMTVPFKAGSVTKVDIDTLSGNNTVNIDATAPGESVSVDLVLGTGTVNISPSTENLDSIQGNVSIIGGSSSDVLNIFDFNNRSQVTYSVTSTAVTRPGAAPISYYWVGHLNLHTGQGDDTCNIESTAQGTPLTVLGGGGDETFNVSPTIGTPITVNGSPTDGYLNTIQSDVTINAGGGGFSTLNVNDINNTQASTWTLSTKTVPGAFFLATYDTIVRSGWSYELDFEAPINGFDEGTNHLVLEGDGDNNAYNIEGTEPGIAVTVQGGNGNDTYNISPKAKNLDNIQGAVDVSSGLGANVLNIFDVNNPQAVTDSVTSSTVTRTGAAPITYNSPNHVNLYDGSGNNTDNIESTASGCPLTVYGGNGNETFNVSPTAGNLSAIQSNVTINAAAGLSTLNVNDTKNAQASTWTLSTKSVSGGSSLATYDTIVRSGWSYELDFEAPLSGFNKVTGTLVVNGGSGNNTYNVESTEPGISLTLQGGIGNDTFNISPTTKNLDTILGNVGIRGGLGANALNIFDGNNANADTYSVTSSTVTRTGSATISYDSFTENLTLDGGSANDTYDIASTSNSTSVHINGGSGTNTLEGPNATNTWTITGPNAGTMGNLSFDKFANLIGGTGNDTFKFLDGAGVTGTIDGGGGAAALDYSAYTTPVTVNLATGQATGIGGGVANIRADIWTLTGGTASNTLIGPGKEGTLTTWVITATNTGALAGVIFNGFQDLTGGTGNDTFKFLKGAGVTGAIDGGGGADALDYSAYTTPVTVNLATGQATGIGGSFANITKVIGGAASNTLIGPNTTSTWTITAANAGTVGNVSFDKIANLTGGTGLDVFVFGNGAGITGAINGNGGGDWLDYSAYTTAVTVNLATGTATGVGGGVTNIQHVRGGQAGNNLTGNAQGNILIGGAGANSIVGFTGRSILIGGRGQDTVTGNSGSDILIAGYTDYDSSSLANDLALESILAEWQSANSYATRISHIKNGGGLNGSNTLVWGTTVFDNATSNANTLTGAGGKSGLNWFFANPSHTQTNKTAGEQLN
jgi:hypothetical protein